MGYETFAMILTFNLKDLIAVVISYLIVFRTVMAY